MCARIANTAQQSKQASKQKRRRQWNLYMELCSAVYSCYCCCCVLFCANVCKFHIVIAFRTNEMFDSVKMPSELKPHNFCFVFCCFYNCCFVLLLLMLMCVELCLWCVMGSFPGTICRHHTQFQNKLSIIFYGSLEFNWKHTTMWRHLLLQCWRSYYCNYRK